MVRSPLHDGAVIIRGPQILAAACLLPLEDTQDRASHRYGMRHRAALVYQRNLHFINLFVWPSNNKGIGQEEQLARQGYNLIHWTQAGMTHWLISELNLPELKECAQLLKQ